MIAGLEDISSGELRIGGERVNERPARERNLAMVFQSYALYPHLSLFENIAFPLRLGKHTDEEVRRRVTEVAQLLELTGQPLSNLDAKLRGHMRTEIARLQRTLGVTTVYVTHDQTEALTLGQRVAVLRAGSLQQVAPPRELYERPANLFVAGFIGSPPMNFLPAVVEGRTIRLPFATLAVPEELLRHVGGRRLLVAGIRPEHVEDASLVGAEALRRGATFELPVEAVEWLGNEQYAYLPLPAAGEPLRGVEARLDGEPLRDELVVSLDAASRIRGGDRARLWFDPRRLLLFDPAGGEAVAPP
jgi:multiple sugar transport system ATP-binding protein